MNRRQITAWPEPAEEGTSSRMNSSRGSMSHKARAQRALAAMNSLGFSKKLAYPVLKRLHNLYDKKWELIEDDNYRALAEAVLDAQMNGGPVDDGDQELEQDEDRHQRHSTVRSDSDDEMDTPDSPDFMTDLATNRRGNSDDFPSPPPRRGAMVISPRGATPLQSRASPRLLGRRRRQVMEEDLQHDVFLREPKPEPDDMDASNCQNAQLGLVDLPHGARSSRVLALPPPDRNSKRISGAENRTTQHCRNREMSSSVAPTSNIMNNETGSRVRNMQAATCLDIDVASSAMGEVKMSLKCSLDPSKFCMPALEAVFKMVENKCLLSHKVLPPDLSIGSLMKEICQCVVQLGTEDTVEHNMQSDSIGNGSRSENGVNQKQKAAEELFVSKDSGNGPVNSTLAQERHLALSTLRTIHDVTDISKGEERVRISIVNEFGEEKCPPSFYYMPRNTVFRNARVSASLSKIGDEDCCADCFGNCLSAPVPCACARKTGGEYVYTPEGLVRPAFMDDCVSVSRFPEKHHMVFCKTCPLESSRNKASPEPCRGHLVRKFIKECWSKCGCSMQCGNRVVQRGISCNLQVFFTENGTGWGLRTLDELPRGAFVCEYAGEILTNTELHERAAQNMHPIVLDAGWCSSEGLLKDEKALCLDATFYGNVGRFINHRCCDANLVVIPVEVETPDHHYYHVAFFTSKKVEAFEELTWDYGIDFDHAKASFQCVCGSRYCRGRKWRLDDQRM